MQINFIQLKGLVKVLSQIREELTRIGDCMEMDMADKGYRVRVPTPSAPEDSSVDYVDEEVEWGRENIKDFDSLYSKTAANKTEDVGNYPIT